MGKSNFISIILVTSTLLVSSCGVVSEVVTDVLVGDTMSDAFNGKSETWKTVETEVANNKNQKRLTKKQEELMKEGKCPICFGTGKSADGKYTCATCNGTGKYSSSQKEE